jgi:predicted nucleotidyltransferase
MIKTRLRDFIITKDDWIFAVADYFHPDGIRSTFRYVPDENGERELDGIRYKKYDFDVAFDFMRENRPEWVQDVHVVPENEVKRLLHPSECIPQLVETDHRVAAIVEVLKDAGIPLSQMGVTGSLLPGLQNETSDIDFVVYGKDWFTARDAIAAAKLSSNSKAGSIENIDDAMWQRIYEKRIPEISFDEFILHEKRKGNRGMVDGTYFDLLFVRDWDQIKEPMQRGKDPGMFPGDTRLQGTDFSGNFHQVTPQ